ncbi:hypothetical protein BG842_23735 [Haladaptatus sp. W1]|uniref:DUF7344 domain-containing protein n=1 Tax=Haladaptatus sp. W1 TaxID=1897478 RepID=UPI0008499129|nr:hypothetical protein [Haladaptatus sp. W1]ODR80786.1 hypothetical protein BG842_23735 [Haladaptatus sp. W1]
MVTNTHTNHHDDTCVSSTAELFSIYGHHRRRIALRYLLDHECPVSLDELATFVVEHEAVCTDDRRCVSIELHHNHLPRLDCHGCIEYDIDTNTVERAFDDPTLKTAFERATGTFG